MCGSARLNENGLNDRQQKFVDAYLVSGNATDAYLKAGYDPKNANAIAASAARLLRNAKVQAALEKARTARSERTKITADWVLERLKIESEREGEKASHSARVSALKAIGEHLGMFSDADLLSRVVALEKQDDERDAAEADREPGEASLGASPAIEAEVSGLPGGVHPGSPETNAVGEAEGNLPPTSDAAVQSAGESLP